jgi:hypothetical protein
MNVELLREQIERCKRLAKHAEPLPRSGYSLWQLNMKPAVSSWKRAIAGRGAPAAEASRAGARAESKKLAQVPTPVNLAVMKAKCR